MPDHAVTRLPSKMTITTMCVAEWLNIGSTTQNCGPSGREMSELEFYALVAVLSATFVGIWTWALIRSKRCRRP